MCLPFGFVSVEKSLSTIKFLLEYVDEEDSIDNDPPSNNNPRIPFTTPEPSNERIAPNPAPNSSFSLSSGSTSSRRNPVQITKISYSSSVAQAGAVPKSAANEKKITAMSKAQRREKLQKAYNDSLKQKNLVLRIKSFALEGIKVMVIMRGCPGSGKTYLVQHLANSLSSEQSKALGWTVTHPVDHHIFSADDFWINPLGKYVFNSEYIEYAHKWNQKLVRQAASEGRSPIFVDNTHTRLWEMQTVATIAVEFGYLIEIVDSKDVKTQKWAFSVNDLVRRNVHGVHYDAIKRMVERYELDVTPKKIFKTYNLSYQPHLAPPQRCLVTFSTPPSKSHMKIFNTRFHFVPLKDILALKSSEPGTDNSGLKTRNAPSNSSAYEKDPRNPMVYKAAEYMTPKRNEDVVYRERDFRGIDKSRVEISDLPQKDGNRPVQPPVQFPWTVPPTQYASQYKFMPSSPVQNQDASPLISPAEYIWSSPSDTASASNPADSSVDLLLSLNEDTIDSNPNRPLQPQRTPTKSPESDNSSSYNLHIGISPSNSDLLLSFEEVSQGTSKSSSTSAMSHFHSPEGELYKNPGLSPCKEVYPDKDSDDSDSSCEEIPISWPSKSCNEFGHEVTSEYVLVQPGGYLKFQRFRENLPITLKQFRAAGSMEKLKNKLVKSMNQRDSGPVNKLMNPFFKKSAKNESNVPMYSDDSLLTSGNRVALSEKMTEPAVPSVEIHPVHEASEDAEQLDPNSNSVDDEPVNGFSLHSKQTESSHVETYTVAGMTAEAFINQACSKVDSNLNKNPFLELQKSDSSAGPSTSVEGVGSTWDEPKETEPVNISRTDSPKRQRSQIVRTLTKNCDKGTDANYFEILSKANTSDGLCNNDVILFGNANSFQSSSSPPKPDGIKAVATHEKSSMTKSDESADEIDSGIEILTKMFPDVSLDCLVDLFEKCQKNLYWTANLLMDSGEEISEHFNADVAPRGESPPPSPPPQMAEAASEPSSKESLTAPSSLKKLKKNRHKLTEEHMDLVRELESNFILNEDHYSETLKKVRETKFGRPVESEPVEEPSQSRESTPNDPVSPSSSFF